jgi:hypothetical protein
MIDGGGAFHDELVKERGFGPQRITGLGSDAAGGIMCFVITKLSYLA